MKILFFLLASVFSSFTWAESTIETIQLNHRLALEVLPEVQAFLPKDSTARAFNEFIIVKAEPAVISQIKQLIHKLDTPLQRLKVSVLKTDELLINKQRHQDSASILIDDENLSGVGSIRRWSTQNAREQDEQYQAQGLAGRPVSISMGQAIPQQEQYLILRADGDIALQSTTHYLNIDNGFKAIARILPNNQVAIDIHPNFNHFSNRTGIVDKSQIITSIAGPINTWIELGQISNDKNIGKQGETRYQSRRQQLQIIYIKVEQI